MKFLKLFLFLLVVLQISSQGQKVKDLRYLNDSVIKKQLNEIFYLRFEACHDCGYLWFLQQIDSNKVKLLDKTFESTSGKTNVYGGNVYETWKFIGLQKGSYFLNFYYKRPWLNEVDKTEQIKLVIQ